MRPFAVKVLTTGVPTALAAALIGYGLACFLGGFADSTAGVSDESPSARMKVRMPLVLGGTSFAVLVALEGVSALVKRPAPSPPPASAVTASGLDAEVEALLNTILAQTPSTDTVRAPARGADRRPTESRRKRRA